MRISGYDVPAETETAGKSIFIPHCCGICGKKAAWEHFVSGLNEEICYECLFVAKDIFSPLYSDRKVGIYERV